MLPQFPEVNRPEAKEDQLQNEAGTRHKLLNELGWKSFSKHSPSPVGALFSLRTIREVECPFLKAPASWFDPLSGFQTRDHPCSSCFSSQRLDIEAHMRVSTTMLSQGKQDWSLLETLSEFQSLYIPPKNYWTSLQITNTETQHKHYYVILPGCFPA